MTRTLVTLITASALYGFSIGWVHSPLFAARNLLKFPLLILVTAAICSLSHLLLARLITGALSWSRVQALVLRMFRDTALLLAALGPVCLFLACALEPPDRQGLNEYPLFLGLNVLFIAGCASLALVRQTRALMQREGISRRRGLLVVAAWLSLSLVVGGQWAWHLRPFFGVRSISGAETSWCLGTAPDYRGATSFFEAVYHLLRPPPLPDDFYLRGRGEGTGQPSAGILPGDAIDRGQRNDLAR